MGSQVRVTVASESVYRTNCSLRASAIHFRVSTASGFAPAEPPTMARPWHQLSLSSLHYQHSDRHIVRHALRQAITGAPMSHRIGRDRRVALVHQGQRPLRRPCRHSDKLQGLEMPPTLIGRHVANTCITPVPPFNYKRERPGPFLDTHR